MSSLVIYFEFCRPNNVRENGDTAKAVTQIKGGRKFICTVSIDDAIFNAFGENGRNKFLGRNKNLRSTDLSLQKRQVILDLGSKQIFISLFRTFGRGLIKWTLGQAYSLTIIYTCKQTNIKQ